jgi:hypothetical protein
MAIELVGRQEELDSLRAFIGESHGGPAAFVLEGEAGIGKSTLSSMPAGVGELPRRSLPSDEFRR